MFFELIATFAAGFAAAGIVLVINISLGRRLPKWFTPVAAGAAMLVATISSEYSWYPRTKATLPEGVEVVQTVEGKSSYRPWARLKPFVERFVAVDTASIRTHEAQPDMRLVDTYYFGRWAPVNKRSVLTDCANGRRAELVDAITFNDDGTVDGIQWFAAPEDDALILKICEG